MTIPPARFALALALAAPLFAAPLFAAPALAAETFGPEPGAAAAEAAPETPAAAPGTDLAALAPDAAIAPRPRPAEARHCAPDGGACISVATYLPDVCRTLEQTATASALDPGFFARLIWRESLFEAGAVSPAGAQGIAQFIPETARIQGLGDSFNPAEALTVSARYLAALTRAYGNLGLAAVAYNGGEARAERFIAGEGGLPLETRAYVQAITGFSAEEWRDAPPASFDLALDGDGDFQARCLALAATRGRRELDAGPPLPAWGVIIASNRSRDGAARQAGRLKNRNAGLLKGETIHFSRSRRAGMPRSMYFAQVGRDSRAGAEQLCARLRAAGGDCMVLKN